MMSSSSHTAYSMSIIKHFLSIKNIPVIKNVSETCIPQTNNVSDVRVARPPPAAWAGSRAQGPRDQRRGEMSTWSSSQCGERGQANKSAQCGGGGAAGTGQGQPGSKEQFAGNYSVG